MTPNSIEGMLESIRQYQLLTQPQIQTVLAEIAVDQTSPQDFARLLIAKNLLSTYQARKLYQNKAQELMVGTYLILDKIGEGGMGRVYKARQSRLNRVVALKVLRAQLLDNPTAIGRFHREARSAGALDHPNIVHLIDAEEIGPYHTLVMEYVNGQDLSAIVKQSGPLRIDLACQSILQVARGLQHAHENGIVHRDIKPSNMLVSIDESGGWGEVKILDMGLARPVLDESDVAHTQLTLEGNVLGTPDYMSPEQAKDSRTVDPRADLYSLGCSMFFLLTGRPPFVKSTAMEKLLCHQLDQPPLVSKLRPETPWEIDAIVARLLAKSPDDRFQSAQELADELSRVDLSDFGGPLSERVLKKARSQSVINPQLSVSTFTLPEIELATQTLPKPVGPIANSSALLPTPPKPVLAVPIATPLATRVATPVATPVAKPVATPVVMSEEATFEFPEPLAELPSKIVPKRPAKRPRIRLGLLLVSVGTLMTAIVFLGLSQISREPSSISAIDSQVSEPRLLENSPRSKPTANGANSNATATEQKLSKLILADSGAVVVVNVGVLLEKPELRANLITCFPLFWQQLSTVIAPTLPESLDRIMLVLPRATAPMQVTKSYVIIQTREPMVLLRQRLDARPKEPIDDPILTSAFAPIYRGPSDLPAGSRSFVTFLDAQMLVIAEERITLIELIRRRAKPPSDDNSRSDLESALAMIDHTGVAWMAAVPSAILDDPAIAESFRSIVAKLDVNARFEVDATLTGTNGAIMKREIARLLLTASEISVIDKRLMILGDWARSISLRTPMGDSGGIVRLRSGLAAEQFESWFAERMKDPETGAILRKWIGTESLIARFPSILGVAAPIYTPPIVPIPVPVPVPVPGPVVPGAPAPVPTAPVTPTPVPVPVPVPAPKS